MKVVENIRYIWSHLQNARNRRLKIYEYWKIFSPFFCWCGQNYLIFCRLYLQHTGILTTKTKMCELKWDQKHLYQSCVSSCWVNSGFCMCNWQVYWFVVVCGHNSTSGALFINKAFISNRKKTVHVQYCCKYILLNETMLLLHLIFIFAWKVSIYI